jgi:hypothetical protein
MIWQFCVKHFCRESGYFVVAVCINWHGVFIENMSDKLLQQSVNFKVFMKLEKNGTDIYKMLQHVYGEGTVSATPGLFGLILCL